MLVLTRKVGESIVINNNIHITLVSIAPGRVKIGIDAPKDVVITREELLKALDQVEIVTPVPIPEPAPQPHVVEKAKAPPRMHNRISGKFPPPAPVPSTSMQETKPVDLEERLARLRRKPR